MHTRLFRTAALIVLPLTALTLAWSAVAQPEGDAARAWQLDPVHSTVVFRIMHANTAPFYGTFETIEGAITTGQNAAFRFTIPVESVDTNHPQRDAHLKTPDFFDAAQFPEITFQSTAVERDGDDYRVTGDLTLHGVTKSIEVDVKKTGQATTRHGELIGLEAIFTVRRSDFGMDQMLDMLGDEVKLMIGLEAKAE